MKTNIKKIEECKRLLEVELPEDVVCEKFRQVYAELKAKAVIPGFRPGKVPQELLEKYYRKTAESEVSQRLILESYESALRETDLIPINSPQIKDVKLEEKNAFSFKAEIEIRPQVKLKGYKNLRIKKQKAEVSSQDVEEALLRLQQMNAQLRPVSGRAAKGEDWLLCDYKSFKGDKCVEEKENAWIALEEGRSAKELIEGLRGANIGEKRTIKEKEGTHSILVKEIKEKILPSLDDDFALTVGKCKNLAELKDLIRNDLVRRNEAKVKLDMKNQLSAQLLKNNAFSCPSSLIEEELGHMVNQAKLRLTYQGVEKEKILSEEEKIKESLRAEAERRVRFSFILDEIARQENISVSAEEAESALKSIEEKTGEKINPAKKDLMSNLRFQLREEKTVDFLLKEARIVNNS